MPETIECPKCGADEVHFRRTRGDWICDKCEHVWKPVADAVNAGSAGPIAVFLSYARGDDEPFVRKLYEDLKRREDVTGQPLFRVWYDREDMPSRQLTFHHEIRTAVNACDRLLLVVGPKAVESDYVAQEWQFAHFVANKCVNPILRLDGEAPDGSKVDGYDLIPEAVNKVDAQDFRDDSQYTQHFETLVRQLSEPLPPVGELVAVPELPPGFRAQPERLEVLRDILLADLQKPVVVSGAAARIGVQGMGGIGKSVLANAMARHPEVRRAFKDGIFWIALGQEPNVMETQRWLARQLGGEGMFETKTDGREELRKLLAEREALLILDDIWSREHAEAFNVIGPRGRILLTTRDAGLVTALASRENHYEVNLPSQAEAEGILASAAQVDPTTLPPPAIETIAECGKLPLALALCGGMVQGSTSWQDVLDALKNHDLPYLSADHPAEKQHCDVWTAMNVSLRVLSEDQQDRFAELAVFPLDTGAVDTAITTLWEHTCGMTARNARKLLDDFSRRSLVRITSTDGERGPRQLIVLHDLLHNFATGMAVKRFGSETALHERLIDAYRGKCPDGWHSGPNDGYFLQNLVCHLIILQDWCDVIGDDKNPGVLTDLSFVQAKCEAALTHDLVHDYSFALARLPEFREEQNYLERHDETMRTYHRELRAYAVSRYDYARFRERGTECTEPPYPELPANLAEGSRPPFPEETSARAARLLHFANFVSTHTTPLSSAPTEVLAIAFNSSKESPVSVLAEQQIEARVTPWFRRSQRPPPAPPVVSACAYFKAPALGTAPASGLAASSETKF